jgi:anaphase-promoting complex subunit 4
MEAAAAFTPLLDRGLAAEGCLAAWCPTMDLLALATTDGQLHVHRLNWQRLWWASPEAAITGGCAKSVDVKLQGGTRLLCCCASG